MAYYSGAYVPNLANPQTSQQPVTGVAAQLPDMPCKLCFLKNDDAAGSAIDLFVGGATVTSATGFRLKPGEGISFTVTNADVIWAVTGGGAATIDILTLS